MAAKGKVDIVGIRTWGVAGLCAIVAVALGISGSQQAGWADDVRTAEGDVATPVGITEVAVADDAGGVPAPIELTAPLMNIPKLISQLTLEEKAGMCSGRNFWFTKEVERLNIPGVMLSDGPHGLRKQATGGDHLGVNGSVEAVCFPTASAIAASFDRDLIREMGEALGDECQAEDIAIILGPGVNIKRSPLCGRNFEFLSEDPYLATQLATDYIQGVQSKNIGTSLKHFLANNQEHRRMSSSSDIDERTLREIYLAAFEGAVVNAKPWTVMCSYNKINH